MNARRGHHVKRAGRDRRVARPVVWTVALMLLTGGTWIAVLGPTADPSLPRSTGAVALPAAPATGTVATATAPAGPAGDVAAGPQVLAEVAPRPLEQEGTQTDAEEAIGERKDAMPTTAPAPTPSVPIEKGTYVLWSKSANQVLLVRDGKVIRRMATTDLDVMPVGDYTVRYRFREGHSAVEGVDFVLPYFIEYGPIPGHDGVGFHAIPVTRQGQPIQPLDSVGKAGYSSHGCQRVSLADAKAIWDFAPVGTVVKIRA